MARKKSGKKCIFNVSGALRLLLEEKWRSFDEEHD
jgi:hypothetical protein